MKIPIINLARQHQKLDREINGAVRQVLSSGRYILGPECKALEQEIARLSGVKYGLGLANGTDALVLALKALQIGPGDEVITSPFTFFASAECISQVGATPVFADIDPRTFNIDPASVAARVTKRTKAIIPVHIFGQPCDIDGILDIARNYNLVVVEDACQAIGSRFMDKPVGSFGHVACYSFFPTKNLGGIGDGGMLVTDDEVIADTVKVLRVHGSRKKYFHEAVGYNSRLDELQAAIIRVKLQYLDQWNKRRQQIAQVYNQELAGLVTTPHVLPNVTSVYHLYVIRTPKRDELKDYLAQQGIATGVYYPLPLHLQRVYSNLGYKPGDLIEAETASREVLALPACPELTDEEQEQVIAKVKGFFQKGA